MNKITVNSLIKKDSKVLYFKKDKYHHLTIDGFFIIRFDTFHFFTASAERKIKETMTEDKKIYDLYNQMIETYADENIIPTNYSKKTRNDQFDIFKTKNHLKYLNVKYTNLLKNNIHDYYIRSSDNHVTPVLFTHKKQNISFVLVPARLDEKEFDFKVVKQ